MDAFFANILGSYGVVGLIGLMVFTSVFRYSKSIFQWVEDRTYSNREEILKKLELIFVDYDATKLTYILLGVAFGPSLLVLIILSFSGHFFLGLFFASVLTAIGWKIPLPFVQFLVDKKNKDYQNQMVDGLQLLANGLRAGQSLPQSIGMVVTELSPPLSLEFNHVLQQNRIGLPLEECLEELVKRVPIQDNEMFVTSINILHETGGNLPETFSTIVDIIRERVRLQQKIDTYVARGLVQGVVMFMMPFLMGSYFAFSDPSSMLKLFTTPIGLLLFFAAIAFNFTGGFFILKIARIKI